MSNPTWWLVDDEEFVIAGPYESKAAADEGNQDLHASRLTAGYGRRDRDGFLNAAHLPSQGTIGAS